MDRGIMGYAKVQTQILYDNPFKLIHYYYYYFYCHVTIKGEMYTHIYIYIYTIYIFQIHFLHYLRKNFKQIFQFNVIEILTFSLHF